VYRAAVSRTNIEIDEELVRSVMAMYDLPTKRAAVDFALRQVAVRPMSVDQMRTMRGYGWYGDLEESRSGSGVPEADRDAASA
jgi:Arc/MetJ family transcription regulator